MNRYLLHTIIRFFRLPRFFRLLLLFGIIVSIFFGQRDTFSKNFPEFSQLQGRAHEVLSSVSQFLPFSQKPQEQGLSKSSHLVYGKPSETDQLLIRDGFVVGYNYTTRQADWVSYHMTPNSVQPKLARTNDFQEDLEVPKKFRSTLSDYFRSGFDKGHFAPNASMDFSAKSMTQAFQLSNITPQSPTLNRGIWRELESKLRNFAYSTEIVVVTGPVFSTSNIKYCGQVPIPAAFWKIAYLPTQQQMLAYYIPNSQQNYLELSQYQVTVDDIENLTSYDFFANLPDTLEERLESQM